jgi:hypothetical protein
MLADGETDGDELDFGFLVLVGVGFSVGNPALGNVDGPADADVLGETPLRPDEPASLVVFEQAPSVAASPTATSTDRADFMSGTVRPDRSPSHLSVANALVI